MRSVTFAIPGDIETLTGGYIYEKQVLLGLRRVGWGVTYLPLPGGFPAPTQAEIARTVQALTALAPDRPVILDGFLTGAMPPEQLSRMRAPFVSITHHPLAYETGLSEERADYLMRVERANLARAAHVIVPSPHTGTMLERDFGVPPNQITVAPPGVSRVERHPHAETSLASILVVGQLVPRKGHDMLLRALGEIADLDWTVSIVGQASDDGYARSLLELRDRLGLTSRVHFEGSLAPEKLNARYASASVFALATRYEGYGMVFAEAMAHGLPVISCDGGAVRDTVPEEAGLLVPVGDVSAFATALRRVLTDDALRASLAQGSVRYGTTLPNWDDTACIVSDVLRQATA